MKFVNFVSLFIVNAMMNISLIAQVQTLILQPGPSDGKDALIRDDFPTTPFGNDVNFTSNAWTVGGNPCILRSLISFDLSGIPDSATVLSASLSLYCNIYSGIYQLQYGDNESYLLRITEYWDESSVTWITQPNTTFQSKVQLPSSTTQTQDYPNIDVTLPVQEMIMDPSSNFGWMLQLVTEELYRSLVFASSDNPIDDLRPRLEVKYMNCPEPVADFGYVQQSKQVNFYDSSSSATSWYWDFGDGYFSDLQNPDHEYSQFGIYFVCLQIEDSCGTDEYCDTVYLCEALYTKFSDSVNGHFVGFIDLSFNATSWSWSFGDGFFSDLKDPLHYFNDYGDYYVCLTSGNECKQETWCDTLQIRPSGIHHAISSPLKVYPNPAHGSIFASAGKQYINQPGLYEIIDQLGIIRKRGMMTYYSNSCEIDVSDLSQGLYSLRVIAGRIVMIRNFLIY